MRPARERGLRWQGTLLLAALVISVELVYAAAATSALRESEGRAEREQLADAGGLAHSVDALIEWGRGRLGAVAQQPGLSLWLSTAQAEKLARTEAIPQRETLHYLFFQTAIFSGQVALVDRAGRKLWTEPYDAKAIEARQVAANPVIRAVLGDGRERAVFGGLDSPSAPAFLLVQPLYGLRGEPVGALAGELLVRDARFPLALRERGSEATVELLDETGKPLLQTASADWIARATLPAPGQVQRLTAGGDRWLVTRAPLHSTSGSVVVAVRLAEAEASANRLQVTLLGLGVLLALAATATFALALSRLVRPVEELTFAAHELASGRFQQVLPKQAPGELGQLSRAFGQMRDELQGTLRRLQASEERYRSSIDSAADAIFAVDPHAHRVLHANRRAQETLGAAEVALVGRRFDSLFTPENRDSVERLLATVARAGEGTVPEAAVAVPDGVIPLGLSAGAIATPDGRFVQVIARDLREQKRLQAELVQAEKLSTVGVLAAGILHELNTPLAYAQANLEELTQRLRDSASLHSVDAAPLVKDSLEGVQRAAGISRDLRVFARATDAQGAFDINDAVRLAVRLSQHETKYRAKVELELAALPPVRGHATQVSQVFLNLIVNAAHAIPAGRPHEHRIHITSALSGSAASVCIADTGAGISPQVLDRIFEPFFTTKPEGVGTGLGLSISREIVARLGGTISVHSEVGRGTRFTVELPLERA